MAMSHMSLDQRAEFLENIIRYEFTNRAVPYEALRTAGALALAGGAYRPDGNKDLAQIGDAALRLILVMDGYEARASRRELAPPNVPGMTTNRFHRPHRPGRPGPGQQPPSRTSRL
jgi:hypothetical protein